MHKKRGGWKEAAVASRGGRSLRPIDPDADPLLVSFVEDLRKLFLESRLTIRDTAAATQISATSISVAFAGRFLPSPPLLSPLVEAWGGDVNEWLARRDGILAQARMRPYPEGIEQQQGLSPERRGRPQASIAENPNQAAVELAVHLRLLREQAGGPSLSRIAGGVDVNTSTISRVFNAKVVPSWDVVRSILTVLSAADEGREKCRDLWWAARAADRELQISDLSQAGDTDAAELRERLARTEKALRQAEVARAAAEQNVSSLTQLATELRHRLSRLEDSAGNAEASQPDDPI